MDTVDIRYRSVPVLRIYSKLKRIVPAKWNEASENHLLSVSKYLCAGMSERDFITEFLNIPGRIAKRFTDFEVWKIEQYIKLIEEDGPFDRFLIREVKCGKHILRTPKHRLKDTTFGDFVLFDSLYLDYDAGRRSVLESFVTHLCGVPDGSVDEMTEQLKQTDFHIKHAITLNYGMIREWLGLRYTYLFVKNESKKPKKKPQNWLPILDALIANDLANADKYEKLPVHTVLRKLNNQIKESYKHG